MKALHLLLVIALLLSAPSAFADGKSKKIPEAVKTEMLRSIQCSAMSMEANKLTVKEHESFYVNVMRNFADRLDQKTIDASVNTIKFGFPLAMAATIVVAASQKENSARMIFQTGMGMGMIAIPMLMSTASSLVEKDEGEKKPESVLSGEKFNEQMRLITTNLGNFFALNLAQIQTFKKALTEKVLETYARDRQGKVDPLQVLANTLHEGKPLISEAVYTSAMALRDSLAKVKKEETAKKFSDERFADEFKGYIASLQALDALRKEKRVELSDSKFVFSCLKQAQATLKLLNNSYSAEESDEEFLKRMQREEQEDAR